MILTEGGQLVIHDLLHWQPQPLTLPAQELPPITVSKLVPTVNAEQQGEPGGSAAVSPRSPSAASVGLPSPSPLDPGPLSAQSCPAGPAASLPQHALTLDRVRACSRRLGSVPSGGAGQEPSVLEHWPFSGGQASTSLAGSGGGRRHPSALFFSGHRDGGSTWGGEMRWACLRCMPWPKLGANQHSSSKELSRRGACWHQRTRQTHTYLMRTNCRSGAGVGRHHPGS